MISSDAFSDAPCTPEAQALRTALHKHDLFTPHQVATRRWPIGCVSLEVTQRCNLDCSLCYLSEHSEAVKDFPLEEIYRRIDMIAQQYGANCDVQVSGGDPTLRDHDELTLIVSRIVARGMRASLFTNGILASRQLLARLRQAGLTDVAFHVDMTQQRKGYTSEIDLNALRLEYIDRARGLGLSVFFNTTIHEANLNDVPSLVKFFAEHSDVVRLASFQMQAATGRGLLGHRPDQLTQQRMMALIEQGAGTRLNWDALLGGHPQCNRYATALVLGRERTLSLHDLFADADFIARAMRETAQVVVPRHRVWRAAWTFASAVLARPNLAFAGAKWLLALIWQLRAQLWKITQAPPRKISYFVHNFMSADELIPERIDTCVFMAAGPAGLVPMCEFNAQRDSHLLRPLTLADGQEWQPLREEHVSTVRSDAQGLVSYPIKYLKGRSREKAAQRRKAHVPAHAENTASLLP
jgi:7,8-dihydro-6-hydroxymethylpterin dimethyltransferase